MSACPPALLALVSLLPGPAGGPTPDAAAGVDNPFLNGEFVPTEPPDGPPRTGSEFDAAVAFLTDTPYAADAPRVALDLLTAARAGGRNGEADLARTVLLVHHPDDVRNRFLLKTERGEETRRLLTAAADAMGTRWETAAVTRWFDAARVAARAQDAAEHWKDADLRDRVTLAAFLLFDGASKADREASLRRTRPDLRPEADDGDKPAGKVAWSAKAGRLDDALRHLMGVRGGLKDAADDPPARDRAVDTLTAGETGRSLRDRLVALHALPSSDAAALFTGVLLDRLRADRTAEVEEIRVVYRLEAGRLADAAPVVERLIAAHGPTAGRLFRRGWCAAAAGDAAAARSAFATLRDEFPDSDWNAAAATLSAALDDADGQAERAADALARAAAGFAADWPVQVEAALEWDAADRTVRVHALFDAADASFDVAASADGVPLARLADRPGGTRVFLGGGPIHAVTGTRLGWTPRFATTWDADAARFGFQFGSYVQNPVGDGTLADAARGIAETFTAEHLRVHDRRTRTGGRLTRCVAEADGLTIETLAPSAREPRVDVTRVRLDADGRIVSAASGDVRLTHLRYGPSGSFTTDPPAWPDRQVVTVAKPDGAFWAGLFGEAMVLWGELAAGE